ncbi:hypothetical protein MLD38_030858 [Melastoma candidum]|uniref:Uncharacterized protein n=1 Tax=Melastoma candidum TaxID=119954 RepID=A0ACB9MPV1_9MYRT|nr:hypothetical protein MLD38_030858 [Melastoma candidum]
MDSSCGGSLGSYSGKSSEDGGCGCRSLDERKRKRTISNRESARRSRMRKRKHTEDLTNLVGQLTAENVRIAQRLGSTTRLYLDMEAENSVLRAQVAGLINQLESLNGIIDYVNSTNVFWGRREMDYGSMNCDMWDGLYVNQQPMMANVGILM